MKAQSDSQQVTVAMLGARMHFAVPKILADRGLLSTFFTDLALPPWVSRIISPMASTVGWGAAQRAAARVVPDGIEPVKCFPRFGFEYWKRLRAVRTRDELLSVYLWGGRAFAKKVCEELKRLDCHAYTCSPAGLEILEQVKSMDRVGIVEQSSLPRLRDLELLDSASRKFPGWVDEDMSPTATDLRFAEREREEWHASSLVVVGSEFAARSIKETGCDPGKVAVVPYGVDVTTNTSTPPPETEDQVKVLFVGKVSLRKGAPLMEFAARELRKEGFSFRALGAVSLPNRAHHNLGEVVDLVGRVPGDRVRSELAKADIFVFPSFCEGSATVCYEALAAGLPVVTTPNAGSVVRDKVDGFIVDAGDAEAFTGRINELANDEELRQWMGENALRRAEEFSVERYGDRLLHAIDSATGEKARTCRV